MNRSALGKRINAARKEKGFTSAVASELCDLQQVYFQMIEGGARTPSLAAFVRICNALRVSPNYLLADSIISNEQETLDELSRQLSALTPRQLEKVKPVIDAAIRSVE